MADNYLERRQQELASSQKKVVVRNHLSLDTLLHRNRSYRGYDPSRRASGMNRQVLRFRPVLGPELILPHITLGAALPDEHLPKPGTEPSAFLVVCSTVPEDKVMDIDLGFAAQSILLKATQMGLGGIFILNFRKEAVKEALSLPLEPVAIIAIGKPAESVFLLPSDGENLKYYRKEGVHYVPKLTINHLII